MKYDLPLGKWINATFLGWLIGIAGILIISTVLKAVGITKLHFYIGILMGVGVGFMQWRMLNKIIPVDKKWIWYSILGLSLPFITLDLLPYFTRISLPDYQLPLPIALGAICVSALQLKLLKPFAKKADLWFLASTIGWGLAGLCVVSMSYVEQISSNTIVLFTLRIFLILIGGLILGAISGSFLKNMLANEPRNIKKIKRT